MDSVKPEAQNETPSDSETQSRRGASSLLEFVPEVDLSEAVPNGGIYAWLQVAGSFTFFFNSWGIISSFGVFQTYYDTTNLQSSASKIAWIGSTQSFLLLLIGVLTGALFDFGYFRTLVTIGSTLVVFGLAMTSISTEYWQVFLAQGVCIGLGTGCMFIPCVAVLAQYFTTKRALAMGIATAGSSLGGVVGPVIFKTLEPRIGFGWTVRVLTLIALSTSGFAVIVMRTRPGHEALERRYSLVDSAALKERPYVLFCVAMFFAYLGFFVPVYYISGYAITNGTMETSLAFYLVPILNAASIPGRLIPSFAACKFDPLTVIAPAALISGVLSLVWMAVRTTPSLLAFAVLYGFISGSLISMPSVALARLTEDERVLGTRMGMCSVLNSIGSLCGPPIAGACLKGGNFLGVQLFSGVTLLISGSLMIAAKLVS